MMLNWFPIYRAMFALNKNVFNLHWFKFGSSSFCGCDRVFFRWGFFFLLFQVRVSCRSDMAELAAFSAVGFCSLPCSISLWRYWNMACWTCPPLASRQKILNRFPQLDRLAIAAGTSLLLTAPLRYLRTFRPFPRCIFFLGRLIQAPLAVWNWVDKNIHSIPKKEYLPPLPGRHPHNQQARGWWPSPPR